MDQQTKGHIGFDMQKYEIVLSKKNLQTAGQNLDCTLMLMMDMAVMSMRRIIRMMACDDDGDDDDGDDDYHYHDCSFCYYHYYDGDRGDEHEKNHKDDDM